MSPFCAIVLIILSGPYAKHPGQTVENLDGSWTVDWPEIQEIRDGYFNQDSRLSGQFDAVSEAIQLLMGRGAKYFKEEAKPNNVCPKNFNVNIGVEYVVELDKPAPFQVSPNTPPKLKMIDPDMGMSP